MKIIGIAGKKGSGKTTLTNAIIEYYRMKNISAIELSFAGALKQVCVDIFNINIDVFVDPELKDICINNKYYNKKTNHQKKIDILRVRFGYSNQKAIDTLLNIYKNIKLICDTSVDLPSESIVKNYIEMYNIKPRELMQAVGLIFRRNSMNTWVNIIEKRLKLLNDMESDDSDKFAVVIISDLRFKNELKMIMSKSDRYLIKINRPSLSRDTKCDMHKSETDLDNLEYSFDRVVVNNYNNSNSFQRHTISQLLDVLLI